MNKCQLKGKIKKFDIELYNKYDVPAREKVKNRLGILVEDNPDIYAEDLLLKMNNYEYKYIELQVCVGWVEPKYPYNFPYVYERKGHFSPNTLFVILNKSMTRGLFFGRDCLKKEPKRIKKYSRTYVYQVPWCNVIQFDMDDLTEKLLREYCGEIICEKID